MNYVDAGKSPASTRKKELLRMAKRILGVTSLLALAAVLIALPAARASAASPWWQVVGGSRPTNLWAPMDMVQKIDAPTTPFFLQVDGEMAGVFNLPPTYPEGTAAHVQAALEGAYGAGNVEVTGGPAGVAPLIVTSIGTSAGLYVPPIESPNADVTILQAGGSGRVVLTITNLGDAPVDGTATPVTVTDELPAGVVASGFEALAGVQGSAGPVDCTLDSSSRVSCTFEGILPPYEALEVEIFVSLTEDPPAVAAPGTITVSGGGAPPETVAQQLKISPEQTPFGIESFSARSEEEGGGRTANAGSHPFQLSTSIQFNSGPMRPAPVRRNSFVEQPAQPRNLRFKLPVGLVGNAKSVPQCDLSDYYSPLLFISECPDESAVGVAAVTIVEKGSFGFLRLAVPVFNLPPAPGEPARFGFTAAGAPVLIDTSVDPDDEYRITASVSNATQLAQLLSSTVTLWGSPSDPRHDNARGWNCVYRLENLGPCERPSALQENALLREPVACKAPLSFTAEVEPWNLPAGGIVGMSSFVAPALSGCSHIPFNPTVAAAPSNTSADGPSGLNFAISLPNDGLLGPNAIAEGQAKKIEVTMPVGVTVNPSQASGLIACSPGQYAREQADSAPGEGCPEASKIGSVDISTPLLEEKAHGSVYVAAPHDNPFGSLLALYIVAKIPERGILVKQAGKVELNPDTGQLVTTFDDLPQIPFDTFDLHFKEGDRAPLVMPGACGTYDVTARFTPWHAADPDNPQPNEIVTRTSSFSVDSGPQGGPCPSGTPPFKPGFVAGTESNAAGRYSPLNVRLTREDGEQEFRSFSLKLPKGLVGKLAGVPFCSDAAIAAAQARTGPNGGQEELDGSSCPAASQVGRTLVGAGVGPTLTYAPGKLYLAGPYKGAKLSIVAITTAKVGPFDLGNVVIHQGLKVDPDTAEVSTDGSSGDPIPHILQGIVVHARDIRVYVDRQKFILNPTSCERMAAAAAVIGSGLNFGSPADDQSVDVSAPFQAADCASLGFKPKLKLTLRGGTKRSDTPRLRAVLKARKGDANIGRAQVTLPRSEFLEQAHIRTVCTRVQFNAGVGNGAKCPKGSIYGRAKAISPLLDEPLKGPVFLRSSDNELPDLVAALHSSKVDINLVGRIDSLNGRIRNTFESVPDAPVKKFVLEMQGGKKGLIVNSTNICRGKHRAIADFKGQNGRHSLLRPLVKTSCKR
jgi:hypothetical protein